MCLMSRSRWRLGKLARSAVETGWATGSEMWVATVRSTGSDACKSTGWKFLWIKDGNNKPETDTDFYTITTVSVSDGGRYKCRAGGGDPVYYTHYSNELQLEVT
ncbi:carcinoembryonic antigen-related cell adhesion molecule 5-like, partial [Clarias magur]